MTPLNYKGLTIQISLKIRKIKKVEKQSNIKINVFAWDKD